MTAGRPIATGIDVGGTKLVAATIDAEGRVLDRRRTRTPARDPDGLVDTLVGLVGDLGGPDLPIGVGIAGMVGRDGVVAYGPNIAVRDLPLATALRAATGGAVTVVNDGNAAVLAEQRVGAARGRQDVLLITLGTGVGGGVVAGGELQLGRHGYGGELGHVIVAEGGRPCPCGNRGCIEAYASGTAIALQARDRLVDPEVATSLRGEHDLTGRTVADAAVAGDALAQIVLSDVGRWLGIAVAGLVNALDPDIVLVGGGAAASTAPWVLPAASVALAERVMGRPSRPLPAIELAALGDDAGMVGAALLAADRAGGGAGHAATSEEVPR